MKKIYSLLICACAFFINSCTCHKSMEITDITGKWSIQQALGISTERGENPTFISFTKGGKITGNASVNIFNGEYKLVGKKLTLSNIGTTRMMGASMDIDDAITQAMNKVVSVKTENGKLLLLDAEGNTVMILSK